MSTFLIVAVLVVLLVVFAAMFIWFAYSGRPLILRIKTLNDELNSLKNELMKKDHLCDILNRQVIKLEEENLSFFYRCSNSDRDNEKLKGLLEESRVEIENLRCRHLEEKIAPPIIPGSIDMQKFEKKPVIYLEGLRDDLVVFAKKADEDAELINKLVELLRPKFKSDVLVNPEFYSQYGRVASGAPGKTTYLQWLNSILLHRFNHDLDNGVEDDEF